MRFFCVSFVMFAALSGCSSTVPVANVPDVPQATDVTMADAPEVGTQDIPAPQDVCMIQCPQPPMGCRYEGPVTCVPRSCGTLVCSDGGSPSDAGISCGTSTSSFPTFDATCARDEDCVTAIHQTDCCGNQRGLGIASSQRAAFDAAEALCRPMYPACGCPSQGILCDDDRRTLDPSQVGVTCRTGRCMTFVR